MGGIRVLRKGDKQESTFKRFDTTNSNYGGWGGLNKMSKSGYDKL